MDKEKWMRGAAIFGSCYIKRWLEGRYDLLMALPALAKLKAANPGMKYGVEAILYALTAYAEQKLSDKSPLALMVKTVLMDAAPEISSRLLKDAREDLTSLTTIDVAAIPSNVPSSSIASKLLALEDVPLFSILASLEDMDETARAKFQTFAAHASAEELKRFGALPPEQRNNLLNLQSAVGASGGGGGWWGSAKSFAHDFWEVFHAWSKKTSEVSLRVLNRYLLALVWVLKVSGVLWGVAFIACTVSTLCGRWTLFGVLLGVLAGCGGIIFAGKTIQRSWLTIAGIFSSAVLAVLVMLAAANYADSVFAVAVFFLVGMSVLAIVAMLIPVTAVAEVFQRLFPEGYRTLVRAFQMLASAFFGLLFFSIFLLLFPPQNPVAFLFIVPAAIAVAVCVGVGVVRMNPEAFLKTPVILGVVAVLFVALGVMSMPNLRAKIANSVKVADRQLAGSFDPVEFAASKDIDFTKDDGTVKIWYAERRTGGFDLFRCEGFGPYYSKDGRKLRKADSDDIRQKISEWVDQVAEQKVTVQRRAEENQKAEKLRLAADAKARRVQDEKDRLARCLAVIATDKKVDFLVCAGTADKQGLAEFSTDLADHLKSSGKTATTSVFSQAFVTEGEFEKFINGQGMADIRAMPLAALGSKLLLARCNEVSSLSSSTVDGVYSVTVKMGFTVIETSGGNVVDAFQLSATGPGTSEAEGKAAALERILAQLGKRGY